MIIFDYDGTALGTAHICDGTWHWTSTNGTEGLLTPTPITDVLETLRDDLREANLPPHKRRLVMLYG
jgi:hypothetical protein